MDLTDRHYRYLARLLTRKTLLYTEMIVDQTILNQQHNLDYFLGHSSVEEPLVLQIGGNCPDSIRETIRVCEQHGSSRFCSYNLNVGCPSPRVSQNCFGARLMLEPELVRDISYQMMREANGTPVTVKCRIGVDDVDSYDALHHFISTVALSGVTTFIIHARKCLLEGLSPAQNRHIPPLKYDVVGRLTTDFPQLKFTLNGGVQDLAQTQDLLRQYPSLEGIMIGRAAYNNPWMLATADQDIFGCESNPNLSRREIIHEYLDYAEGMQEKWGNRRNDGVYSMPTSTLIKPLLALFAGEPGGKRFKRNIAYQFKDRTQNSSLQVRQVVETALEDAVSDDVLDRRPDDREERRIAGSDV